MTHIHDEMAHGRRIVHDAEFFWGWATPAGRERLRRRVHMLIEHGKLAPGRKVLELGCGKGLFTSELTASGATVIPLDISHDLLRGAWGRERREAPYLRADAHRLPFADATFDAVVGVSVLHHLRVNRALSETYRVLRPGGACVFSEPNMLNPQILIQKNVPIVKRLLGDSPGETAFFAGRMRRNLHAVGFCGVRVESFDFLHPWTPRRLTPAVERMGRLMERTPLVRRIAGSLLIVGRKPEAESA